MKPVREGFASTNEIAVKRALANNRRYAIVQKNGHSYYGRGFVQLTHGYNYKKEGIYNTPDKALEPEWAARLIFKGLLDGRWNGHGKGLFYYLNQNTWVGTVNARRTVNVLDHAEEVARYYYDFLEALS